MVDDSSLKYWHDAGHVARRTLEAMKEEITVGKSWDEVIHSLKDSSAEMEEILLSLLQLQ